MPTKIPLTESCFSVVILLIILLGPLLSYPLGASQASIKNPIRYGILSEEVNIVQDSGFESGAFDEWYNSGGTGYNQIQSDRVYSGDYALHMDSHFSSTPYEPVIQYFQNISLNNASMFRARVYPTKVGNTAGQAGVDTFGITIMNIQTEAMQYMIYEWSGYTYPYGDLGVNVTYKVLYLLYDLVPNSWNLIQRDLLSDYVAFFGTPENVSNLHVTQLNILSHISNGDPGDFWVDDIQLTNATNYIPVVVPYSSTVYFIIGISSTIVLIVLIRLFMNRKTKQPDYMHPEYIDYG